MLKPFILHLSLVFAAIVSGISCQQYEYSSPGPGILELRLGVKNTRTQLIPFGELNFLNIVIKDMAVLRDDGSFLIVLSDLHAIKRKANGDTLNCLGLAARDSQLILGQVYAPPGKYVDLAQEKMTPVVHDPFIRRFDGARFTIISVVDVAPAQRFTMLYPPPTFEVKSGRKTIVTLTLDLDATMLRRTLWFEWVAPFVYVSSVQYQ